MQIYDDMFTSVEIDEIRSQLLSDEFPWYFAHNVTNTDRSNFDPAFYHHFRSGCKFAELICGRIGYAAPKHARTCLQMPNAGASEALDGLHVDRYRKVYEPHMVVLYYVTDADGPTILTDRFYPECETAPTEFQIFSRVEPKAGRVLVFDGATWHTSVRPKHHVRCIINIHIPKFHVVDLAG